ncbi:MAG: hypothetical protein HUJ76_11245 [Parasporobacterium sp.]|nr:hypothetical protein [Parasporobacterium sp.]
MTFKRAVGNTWKTLVWPVAIYVLFLILTRVFSTQTVFGNLSSLDSIAKQALLSALIALAMACNMINDRWDFSMGIICVTTSFIVTPIVKAIGEPIIEANPTAVSPSFVLLVLCIVVCMLLCMINAALYLIFKIPTLVISIGLMLIYETIERVANDGAGAKFSGLNYTFFGRSPWIYVLAIAAMLIFFVIFTYTKFGYNVRSLGYNQGVANNIGVNEKKNVILSYLLCGFILGIASCVNVSLKGSIEASSTFNNNMGMMFTAFPAVFIGLYLSKYTNFTLGVFIGAFCIKMMTAGILALGLPSAVQDIGVGLFLFLFIALTTNQSRFFDAKNRRAAMKAAKASQK